MREFKLVLSAVIALPLAEAQSAIENKPSDLRLSVAVSEISDTSTASDDEVNEELTRIFLQEIRQSPVLRATSSSPGQFYDPQKNIRHFSNWSELNADYLISGYVNNTPDGVRFFACVIINTKSVSNVHILGYIIEGGSWQRIPNRCLSDFQNKESVAIRDQARALAGGADQRDVIVPAASQQPRGTKAPSAASRGFALIESSAAARIESPRRDDTQSLPICMATSAARSFIDRAGYKVSGTWINTDSKTGRYLLVKDGTADWAFASILTVDQGKPPVFCLGLKGNGNSRATVAAGLAQFSGKMISCGELLKTQRLKPAESPGGDDISTAGAYYDIVNQTMADVSMLAKKNRWTPAKTAQQVKALSEIRSSYGVPEKNFCSSTVKLPLSKAFAALFSSTKHSYQIAFIGNIQSAPRVPAFAGAKRLIVVADRNKVNPNLGRTTMSFLEFGDGSVKASASGFNFETASLP